jgi:hypothetical protein
VARQDTLIECLAKVIALQPALITGERALELLTQLEACTDIENRPNIAAVQPLAVGKRPGLRILVIDERPAI